MTQEALWFILIYKWHYHKEYLIQAYLFLDYRTVKKYIQKEQQYFMLDQLVRDSKAIDKAIAGEELSYDDGLELMNYENLHILGAVADHNFKFIDRRRGRFSCSTVNLF